MIELSLKFPTPTDGGLVLQAADPSRAAPFAPGRGGPTAVMLTTQPGDVNVAGSGTAERCDLFLPASPAYGNAGQEEWWAHSLLFPPSYSAPAQAGEWGVLLDFHNTAAGGGQANAQLLALPGGLEFWICGGSSVVNGPSDPGFFGAPVGPVVPGVWQDFVYHARWAPDATGLFQAWLNGKTLFSYSGPNLYVGQSCYLKLANYHSAIGKAVSVVHSRVLRATAATDLAVPQLSYLAGWSLSVLNLENLASGEYTLL